MAWCRTGGNQLSNPMLTLFIHVYMRCYHYNDVIMSAMASQIIGVSIVSSTVCSGADPRKRQSSASLAFESGIHRSPVNATLKGPVTRKKFPFDDVIMVGRWVKRSELRTSQQIQVKTKHIGRNKFEQATSHSLDEWWPSSRMHWGRDKMAAISQTTFRDAFSSLKTVAFQLILPVHWSLFRPGDSHYLNQWWLIYCGMYTSLSLNELTFLRPPSNITTILQTTYSGA